MRVSAPTQGSHHYHYNNHNKNHRQSYNEESRNTGRNNIVDTCLLLGASSLLALCLSPSQSFSDSEATAGKESTPQLSTKWNEWKQSMMTNYESRIREFSSPEKIFSVFASASKNGRMYMTIDDFIRALIPHQHNFENTHQQKRSPARLPAAFKIADQDGDGLISFEEYLFFVTLLSIPEQSFKVAFRMMDINDDGQVDQSEFVKMMTFLRATSPHAQQVRTHTNGLAQGWLAHYFGENSSKGLTIDAFSKFLQQLKSDVLRMEFNMYDTQEKGYLSQRDFGMLLVSYAHARDLPQYFQRAAALEDTPIKLFNFEQFQNFNLLLEHLSEVETAMQLYQLNGRAFRKNDLFQLSKIICGSNLNQQVIDTVMLIFDKNADGTLDADEFVTVLRRRQARGLSEQRDTGVLRTVNHIWKCLKDRPSV